MERCGVLCVPSEMSLLMFEVGGQRMRIISLTRGVQHRAVNNSSRIHIFLFKEAFNKITFFYKLQTGGRVWSERCLVKQT